MSILLIGWHIGLQINWITNPNEDAAICQLMNSFDLIDLALQLEHQFR